MVQVVTVLKGLYFTSGIPDVEVYCSAPVTFRLLRGGDEVLKERYWPDVRNRVWVRDLGRVVASDLGVVPGFAADYVLRFSDGNTTDEKGVRVVLGEASLPRGKGALDFVSGSFLTLMGDLKVTHVWQKEILSLYATEAVDVTLEKVLDSGERVGPTPIRRIERLNEVVEMDVSAEKILQDAGDVRRYIVKAGDRMMVYFLDREERGEEMEMLFRNAFGCRESFVPRGLIKRTKEYEHVTGFVRDMLFRFRTKEISVLNCNTGVLREGESAWVEDFLVSNEVFLLVGTDLIPVAITDASAVRTNAADELISFDFTCRLSRPNVYGAGKIDIKRIFDDTFDYTFH